MDGEGRQPNLADQTSPNAMAPREAEQPDPAAPAGSQGEGSSKKRRGRPRLSSSGSGPPSKKQATGRGGGRRGQGGRGGSPFGGGRPDGGPPMVPHGGNNGGCCGGRCFIPHYFTVNNGEDVIQRLIEMVENDGRVFTVLSALGTVRDVELCRKYQTDYEDTITYPGLYDIMSMNGSFKLRADGNWEGRFCVVLRALDGGGIIGGSCPVSLIAADPVDIVVGRFPQDDEVNPGGNQVDPLDPKGKGKGPMAPKSPKTTNMPPPPSPPSRTTNRTPLEPPKDGVHYLF